MTGAVREALAEALARAETAEAERGEADRKVRLLNVEKKESMLRVTELEAERDRLRENVAEDDLLVETARRERDRLAGALREARDWIDTSMHSADDDLEGGHALLIRLAALAGEDT